MPNEPQTLTFVVLLLPFATAAAAPLATRLLGHHAAWLLALAPLIALIHFLGLLPAIAAGGTIDDAIDWVPSLGLTFSWFLDGLSLTFALLISGIGVLIMLYSGGYLRGDPRQGKFFAFMLLFMGSMQGLVMADSFLMLFAFWELTSITSFLLIGFDNRREAARRAALQALIVTGAGGLALLAGLLLITSVSGQNAFSTLLAAPDTIVGHVLYLPILLLILAGAFTKSAQVPFHFWLPNAMEAPTPVSAYLHSATMVKAGVYLLMRCNPVLGGTQAWELLLGTVGAATLATGAVLAIRQSDLKLMLAYTTVASLGLLVMLTGIGSETAVAAAVLYLIAHSLFKGALFMVAGILDHETGTRDATELSGLGRAMPLTFAAGFAAALSMCGMPLFFGFLAKEEVYAALGFGSASAGALTVVAVCANALVVAIALAVGLRPFIGPPFATPKRPHEAPLLLIFGPVVLAILGIAAALFAPTVHRLFSSPAASAVAGEPVVVAISSWPHPGLPLTLSAITVMLGVAAFLWSKRLRDAAGKAEAALGWGPDRGFDQAMRGLVRGAHGLTEAIQNGRLDTYMTVTFVVVALTIIIPQFVFSELPGAPAPPRLFAHEWAVVAIAAIGIGAVLAAKDRLTAIVSLGIQGFAVALLFLLAGAPDLAFTQFMVETLSVVILALVMTRLSLSPVDRRPARERTIDAIVAAACGAGLVSVLLAVTELPFDPRLSAFFADHAKTLAHGRNIVNVIIVDFRGLDTLGEIAVVAVAGLAVLALIRGRRGSDIMERAP